MKIDKLAAIIVAQIMGEWDKGASGFFCPDTGLFTGPKQCKTNQPRIVPVPRSEIRFDHTPSVEIIEQYLATSWLSSAGPRAADGIRSHQDSRGYTLNVPTDTVIGFIRSGRYTYLFVAKLAYTGLIAQERAMEQDTEGYLEVWSGEWVRRKEYGDYRMSKEVTLG